MSVQENRQRVIAVMKKVIADGDDFNIHDVEFCVIGYLLETGGHEPRYDVEANAEWFGLPVLVATDLFDLGHRPDHYGDPACDNDPAYHLNRIVAAFAAYPITETL